MDSVQAVGSSGIRREAQFHDHNGTDFAFYVRIALYPDRDRAILLAANSGLPAEPLLPMISEAIRRRLVQDDWAGALMQPEVVLKISLGSWAALVLIVPTG